MGESNFKFLLRVSGREKYKLYLSAVLSAVSAILAIAPYVLLYNMILEMLNDTGDFESLKVQSLWIAGLIVFRMVIFLASGIFSHIAAFTILYELRMKVIEHIGKLNMGFFTSKTIGEVKKTVNEDIEKLENKINRKLKRVKIVFLRRLMHIGFGWQQK